jgi:hypothetical protein
MIDYLWSTRITIDYFDLDFINGREVYFADAATAAAKVASDYFAYVTLGHYSAIANEIKTKAIAGDFTTAWHLINANHYWPEAMMYQDYYFIADPWTTYANELASTYASSTAATDYAAFDQAAWATNAQWGALYN